MDWKKQLQTAVAARQSHVFILHFNINDLVLLDSGLREEFRPYLSRWLTTTNFTPLFYHPTLGPHVYDGQERRNIGLKGAGPLALDADPPEPPIDEDPGPFLKRVEPWLTSGGSENGRCLVLDGLDDLAPVGADHQPAASRLSLTLKRWALDGRIRSRQRLILLLARHLGDVDPDLYDPASRIQPIRVPPPSEEERRRLFPVLTETTANPPPPDRDLGATSGWNDEARAALVNLTGGLGIYQCEGIFALARARQVPVSGRLVKEVKREVIRDTTGSLLEFEDSRRGFAHVGGLDGIKGYLRQVSEDLREGRLVNVPKGILLAGPPGTGKTVLAEALATESHMNLVRMGNIRSKWVGESERNLDLALGVIEDLAPVVVFVDEIDQAFQRGGRGSGDSGVGERIFKKILEVMGDDDRRGRIVWIAATNRADILDDALLRRFDRIFPVLLPGNSLAIARILAVQELRLDGEMVFDLPRVTAQPGAGEARTEAVAKALEDLAAEFTGCSGSELEVLVRHAVEKARQGGGTADPIRVTQDHLQEAWANFKRNHDERVYNAQSVCAIRACNFRDLLPEPDEVPEAIRDAVAAAKERGDNEALDQWLRDHAPELLR